MTTSASCRTQADREASREDREPFRIQNHLSFAWHGTCFINNARNAGMPIICNLDIRVGAQVVNARRLVHEVKAEVI